MDNNERKEPRQEYELHARTNALATSEQNGQHQALIGFLYGRLAAALGSEGSRFQDSGGDCFAFWLLVWCAPPPLPVEPVPLLVRACLCTIGMDRMESQLERYLDSQTQATLCERKGKKVVITSRK